MAGISKFEDPMDRLNQHLVPESNSGCLLWTACSDRQGYGKTAYKGKFWRAHRLVYELQKGKIPNDLFLLHKCDTPSCCNVNHLFPGTNAMNMADMLAKGRHKGAPKKTHCKRGHALIPETVYVNPKTKTRTCIPCHKMHVKLYKMRRK